MVPVFFIVFLFIIYFISCILQLLAPSLATKETSIQEENLSYFSALVGHKGVKTKGQ